MPDGGNPPSLFHVVPAPAPPHAAARAVLPPARKASLDSQGGAWHSAAAGHASELLSALPAPGSAGRWRCPHSDPFGDAEGHCYPCLAALARRASEPGAERHRSRARGVLRRTASAPLPRRRVCFDPHVAFAETWGPEEYDRGIRVRSEPPVEEDGDEDTEDDGEEVCASPDSGVGELWTGVPEPAGLPDLKSFWGKDGGRREAGVRWRARPADSLGRMGSEVVGTRFHV
ncbi:hypothetical protein DFJ74DRAFT_712771 [Hyaloraphidium curvatum]|nr:hypothetical protein DFJ74DRAFT_712771 [Hyaloraphidium curvatum]